MRVLGIDPGIAITGYGVVDFGSNSASAARYQPTAHDYGCILTSKDDIAQERLSQLYTHMQRLLEATKPDVMAVEKLFFNTNVTTAMIVGQARGIVLLAAHQQGIPIAEYTPLQVKGAVCGYGRAKKPQVQQMVQTLLRLQSIPKPDDAADALAIALCHTNMNTVLSIKK